MAKHVIFSRNVNNSALSTERIQQLAPAAFSTTKADRLTDRYVSFRTGEFGKLIAICYLFLLIEFDNYNARTS